jgi:hypothetical protein
MLIGKLQTELTRLFTAILNQALIIFYLKRWMKTVRKGQVIQKFTLTIRATSFGKHGGSIVYLL